MSALTFSVLDVVPQPYAVVPNLVARVRVDETTGEVVHALALRAQVRIEPARRRYSDAEEAGLLDLFGPRERWAGTVRTFDWLHTTAMVPGFTGTTEVDLPLPCTYDVEVTAAKYLHALADGSVPLVLLFSGTVFTRGSHGFGVEQVPWSSEASHAMPVDVWRDLVARHYPASGWVRLEHETVAELARYRSARGLTSTDAAVSALLAGASEGALP